MEEWGPKEGGGGETRKLFLFFFPDSPLSSSLSKLSVKPITRTPSPPPQDKGCGGGGDGFGAPRLFFSNAVTEREKKLSAVIRQIGTGLKWTSKTLLEVTRFGEGAADVLQPAKKC